MMDSNLKKGYEGLKKKIKKKKQATVKQKTALKQNLIRGENCHHQTCSKGEVFFPNNDHLISHVHVNF